MDLFEKTRRCFVTNNDETRFIAHGKELPFTGTVPEEKFFTAHRGTSMNPTLSNIDMLEVVPYQKKRPEIGDVVFFLPPGNKACFVHRIVSTDRDMFQTKGDNNRMLDPWTLRQSNIYGRVIAAYRGTSCRKISNGLPGRLTGKICHTRSIIVKFIIRFLRPAYRSFCTGGTLSSLIPCRLAPQVATFRSGTATTYNLLLGKRIIGTYDQSRLQWQIMRPYRILIDETSLPIPK